jgi:nucleoid-associated protein YgaU
MTQNGKPDFSRVAGSSASSQAAPPAKPDFGNVQGGARSTEALQNTADAQTYTVVQGDTLSHIAQRVYGKASRWQAIFDANRDQLDDPDRILPGQVLRLPTQAAE